MLEIHPLFCQVEPLNSSLKSTRLSKYLSKHNRISDCRRYVLTSSVEAALCGRWKQTRSAVVATNELTVESADILCVI